MDHRHERGLSQRYAPRTHRTWTAQLPSLGRLFKNRYPSGFWAASASKVEAGAKRHASSVQNVLDGCRAGPPSHHQISTYDFVSSGSLARQRPPKYLGLFTLSMQGWLLKCSCRDSTFVGRSPTAEACLDQLRKFLSIFTPDWFDLQLCDDVSDGAWCGGGNLREIHFEESVPDHQWMLVWGVPEEIPTVRPLPPQAYKFVPETQLLSEVNILLVNRMPSIMACSPSAYKHVSQSVL
jgi:hypothetical protein